MLVQVTESVRIRYDTQNYILEKRRIVEKGDNAGTVNWDTVGYYGSLGTAAYSLSTRHFHLIEVESKAHVARDLQDLTDAVAFGGELIANACKVALAAAAA